MDMAKKILTPFEIRDEAQKLVNKIPQILAKEDYVIVPIPFWHEPDENDCNWDVHVSNDTDYAQPVRAIIEKIKKRVNLQCHRPMHHIHSDVRASHSVHTQRRH